MEKSEIDLLDKLLYDGYTYLEIGKKLKRTCRSIQSKCFKLGISIYEVKKDINYEITKCLECDIEINDLKNNNRKFCSRSCSVKYNNKDREIDYNKTKNAICLDCGVNITINIRSSSKSCRCLNCKKIKREKRKEKRICKKCKINELIHRKSYCDNCKYEYYRIYRPNCEFTFNLNDYPNKFNFELIDKFGWYSPTNKNNNLNGVSRDHIYSVRHGFDNGIDTSIISHPANCKINETQWK